MIRSIQDSVVAEELDAGIEGPTLNLNTDFTLVGQTKAVILHGARVVIVSDRATLEQVNLARAVSRPDPPLTIAQVIYLGDRMTTHATQRCALGHRGHTIVVDPQVTIGCGCVLHVDRAGTCC